MKILLKLSFFATVLVLIAISCQKNLSDANSINIISGKEFNATLIKQWYYETLQNTVEFKSSWLRGKKFPDWENGRYRKTGTLEIMEFPLLKEKTEILVPSNSLSSSEIRKVVTGSLTKIVFIRNDKNEIVVREVDYVPDWLYLQKKQFDISKAAFGNQEDNFSGSMIVKNLDAVILSIRLIKDGAINGKVTRTKISSNSSTATTVNTSSTTSCYWVEWCMWAEDCQVIGDQWTNNCGEPYNTGQCFTEEICEGSGEDPCITYGIGCGGGGSGGSSGVAVQNVTNQLTTPCLVNIFNQITEIKLKNQITKLFTQTFIGNGDVVNFKIIEVPSLTGSNGLPQSAQSWMLPTPTGVEWGVKLNTSFANTSSKEYIGLSLIHEIVHSFAQLYTMRTGVLLTDSASHTIMFETWVDQMRDALIDIFGISSTDATALALQGMDDVLQAEDTSGNAYYVPGLNQIAINKYGMDLISARTNSDQYQNKTKGTGCP